ncbi:MAG: signal peptidase I [Lachnospiraceae bacterium]
MKRLIKEILSTSLYLLGVLLLTFLIITYVTQRTEVVGSSMENTLSNGDHLMVDKITYRFKDPERFDIIVFPYHEDKSIFYIKRIIGMPGEQITIDEKGNIYINGEILHESYGAEIMQSPGRANTTIILEDDEYFVLGDNRNNSQDSRDSLVGNIKREEILGRAYVRIWPFSKIEILQHQ